VESTAWADDILESVGIAAEEKFQLKNEWYIPLAVVQIAMEALQIRNLLAVVTMVSQDLAPMTLMSH